MTDTPTMGHNNPPHAVDEISAAYESFRRESENWADGQPVENEAQMQEVDTLRSAMRDWRLELERGQKEATKPLHDAYKAELARWKPTIEDARRIEGCLIGLVDGFKKKLADEKAAAERKAWQEANRLRQEAEAAAARAASSDLAAQREIAAAKQAAIDAEKAAKEAQGDKVKGLRTVTRYEIEDHRAALHDIAANDWEAMTVFIEEYVRRNHKARPINGVRIWQDKEAF